ncbi:hypothetical protein B9Z55_009030 [Caenorhabditis nigoni]|uniref:Uncharacterized protein n=1 Tax=Caenorhabditis nigoni TaxID=1611254 RepID=A0A2G5UR25_9PELO|nr:hypothetical protein B9Z55_009030 [Caenorhabditis nigoni]
MHGRGATASDVTVAHKYCTHPEDKEANFQCDHCTEEVKPSPSTADLPKNELTKNLEEELLRRMRRFDENAMFTVVYGPRRASRQSQGKF